MPTVWGQILILENFRHSIHSCMLKMQPQWANNKHTCFVKWLTTESSVCYRRSFVVNKRKYSQPYLRSPTSDSYFLICANNFCVCYVLHLACMHEWRCNRSWKHSFRFSRQSFRLWACTLSVCSSQRGLQLVGCITRVRGVMGEEMLLSHQLPR